MTTQRRKAGRARNHTGSINKVGERYRAQLRWGTAPRIHLGYFATHDEAQAAIDARTAELREATGEIAGGRWNPTISEYAAVWRPRKLGRASTQQVRLDKLAPIIRHLGDVRLRELTFEQADDLINGTLMTEIQETIDAPYADGTRKLIRDNARAMLNVALKDNRVRLRQNVFAEVEVARHEGDFEARILNSLEEKAFMEAARALDAEKRAERDTNLGVAVDMTGLWEYAFRRGPRCGELLGLTWDNVDLDAGRLYIRQQLQRRRGADAARGSRGTGDGLELVALKTKASRRVLDLTHDEVTMLKEKRRAQLAYARANWNRLNLVWPTVNGNPMQHSALMHEFFRETCQRAGIVYRSRTHPDGFTIHGTRHTAATKMLREPESNLALVQFRLGHSTIAMTRRYVQFLTPEERLRLAA